MAASPSLMLVFHWAAGLGAVAALRGVRFAVPLLFCNSPCISHRPIKFYMVLSNEQPFIPRGRDVGCLGVCAELNRAVGAAPRALPLPTSGFLGCPHPQCPQNSPNLGRPRPHPTPLPTCGAARSWRGRPPGHAPSPWPRPLPRGHAPFAEATPPAPRAPGPLGSAAAPNKGAWRMRAALSPLLIPLTQIPSVLVKNRTHTPNPVSI